MAFFPAAVQPVSGSAVRERSDPPGSRGRAEGAFFRQVREAASSDAISTFGSTFRRMSTIPPPGTNGPRNRVMAHPQFKCK